MDNNNHGPAVYHTLTGNIHSRWRIHWSLGHLWLEREPGAAGSHSSFRGDRRGATLGGAGVWGPGYLPAAIRGRYFAMDCASDAGLNRRARRFRRKSQHTELGLLKSVITFPHVESLQTRVIWKLVSLHQSFVLHCRPRPRIWSELRRSR